MAALAHIAFSLEYCAHLIPEGCTRPLPATWLVTFPRGPAATRQGVRYRPRWRYPCGSHSPGSVPQSTPPRPLAGPKALICIALMEVGLKLLKLPNPELWASCGFLVPTETVIQPGQVRPKMGSFSYVNEYRSICGLESKERPGHLGTISQLTPRTTPCGLLGVMGI